MSEGMSGALKSAEEARARYLANKSSVTAQAFSMASMLYLCSPEFPSTEHWFCDEKNRPFATTAIWMYVEQSHPWAEHKLQAKGFIHLLNRRLAACAKCSRFLQLELPKFEYFLHQSGYKDQDTAKYVNMVVSSRTHTWEALISQRYQAFKQEPTSQSKFNQLCNPLVEAMASFFLFRSQAWEEVVEDPEIFPKRGLEIARWGGYDYCQGYALFLFRKKPELRKFAEESILKATPVAFAADDYRVLSVLLASGGDLLDPSKTAKRDQIVELPCWDLFALQFGELLNCYSPISRALFKLALNTLAIIKSSGPRAQGGTELWEKNGRGAMSCLASLARVVLGHEQGDAVQRRELFIDIACLAAGVDFRSLESEECVEEYVQVSYSHCIQSLIHEAKRAVALFESFEVDERQIFLNTCAKCFLSISRKAQHMQDPSAYFFAIAGVVSQLTEALDLRYKNKAQSEDVSITLDAYKTAKSAAKEIASFFEANAEAKVAHVESRSESIFCNFESQYVLSNCEPKDETALVKELGDRIRGSLSESSKMLPYLVGCLSGLGLAAAMPIFKNLGSKEDANFANYVVVILKEAETASERWPEEWFSELLRSPRAYATILLFAGIFVAEDEMSDGSVKKCARDCAVAALLPCKSRMKDLVRMYSSSMQRAASRVTVICSDFHAELQYAKLFDMLDVYFKTLVLEPSQSEGILEAASYLWKVVWVKSGEIWKKMGKIAEQSNLAAITYLLSASLKCTTSLIESTPALIRENLLDQEKLHYLANALEKGAQNLLRLTRHTKLLDSVYVLFYSGISVLTEYRIKLSESLVSSIKHYSVKTKDTQLPLDQLRTLVRLADENTTDKAPEVEIISSPLSSHFAVPSETVNGGQFSKSSNEAFGSTITANGSSRIAGPTNEKNAAPEVVYVDISDENDGQQSSAKGTSTQIHQSVGLLPKPTSRSGQSQLDSFFKKIPRAEALVNQTIAHPPPPKLAPVKKTESALDQIREQIREQRYGNTAKPAPRPTAPRAIPTEIHPARPAGFNRREKPAAAVPVPKPRTPLNPQKPADESEDSSDDPETQSLGLIALSNRKRNIDNASRIAPDLSGRNRLKPPTIDDKEKEEARMKARLLVDPSSLHRKILKWEFYNDNNFPEGFNLKSVPDTFTSAENYIEIMEPLLLLEAWKGILQAKEEKEGTPFFLTSGSRSSVDDFQELHVSMSSKDYSERKMTDCDLLLVSYSDEDQNPNSKPLWPLRRMPHCLAKVKEGSISYASRKKEAVDLQLRFFDAEGFLSHIIKGRKICAWRITSILTVEREYVALHAFKHCELRSQILKAEPAPLTHPAPVQLEKYINLLNLNVSQARAAFQAYNSQGLNLIQGPPGTGKTKTILAIISAFFSGGINNKRIMVCAPSNAAIDELLLRLKDGVTTLKGEHMDLNLLRIGRTEAVNPLVRSFCLDQKIANEIKQISTVVDADLRNTVINLKNRKQSLEAQLARGDDADPLSAEQVESITNDLNKIRRELGEKRQLLDAQTEQLNMEKRHREVEYKNKQIQHITNAQVVCSTLSGSAFQLLASLKLPFPTVIIDEAAQSVELSALIPFRYGCKQCILVGDPNQLPPTVLSKDAAKLKYEQSLFTRIFKQHKDKVLMLDTQFRMNPDISYFPSKEFYQGILKDGPNMAAVTARPWHSDPRFPKYRFYGVAGEMSKRSNSFQNVEEAKVAVDMISELFRRFPDVDWNNTIAVLAPYKAQAHLLRDKFRASFDSRIFEKVSVSTIDAFQGQEKDIIIFTTVRASEHGSIGFVGDVQRLNVAITRARSSLWIVGHPQSLSRNFVWQRLINDAQRRNLFVPHVRAGDFSSGTVLKSINRSEPSRKRKNLPRIEGHVQNKTRRILDY